MRHIRYLASAIISLTFCADIAAARQLPPFDAKKDLLKFWTTTDKWLEEQCLNPLKYATTCREGAAQRASVFYFRKDYNRSRFYLEAFRQLNEANYGHVPCAAFGFQTKYTPSDVFYEFGYWQAKYALDVAEQRKEARSSGLRAFLCSILGSGYARKQNLSAYRFTRDNFKIFIRHNFSLSENMDPVLFISEIQEPSQLAYKAIAGKFVWGKNWKKNTTVHVSLSKLYDNAEKRCTAIGLSHIYCDFMREMSTFEARVASELATSGEIE